MDAKQTKEFNAWWNNNHDPNIGWVENSVKRAAAKSAWEYQAQKIAALEQEIANLKWSTQR